MHSTSKEELYKGGAIKLLKEIPQTSKLGDFLLSELTQELLASPTCHPSKKRSDWLYSEEYKPSIKEFTHEKMGKLLLL